MARVMLAHQSRGSGPRIVVALHGFLGSARNLGGLVRAWTERDPSLCVLAPDLLGHGRSPPMPPEPSLEALADAVLEWMDELDVPSAAVVGHSLGGRVGLVARTRAPDRIARLDLLDITPGPIPVTDTDHVVAVLASAPDRAPERQAIVDHLRDNGLPDGLVQWLSMNLERAPEGDIRWRIDRQRLADYHHRTREQSLWWAVEAHPERLRLLKGGRSPFVSDGDIAKLRALGVPVGTVEDAGHFVHVDATEAVVDWLSRD
jgi:pimeloyl-ACP methyl ester carboxylesterase